MTSCESGNYTLTAHSILDDKKVVVRLSQMVVGRTGVKTEQTTVIAILQPDYFADFLLDWHGFAAVSSADNLILVQLLMYGNYRGRIFPVESVKVSAPEVTTKLVAQQKLAEIEQGSLF